MPTNRRITLSPAWRQPYLSPTQFGKGPQGMAETFGVPFLGKIPLDSNFLRACEEGKGFVEVKAELLMVLQNTPYVISSAATQAFPGSATSVAFQGIVDKVAEITGN